MSAVGTILLGERRERRRGRCKKVYLERAQNIDNSLLLWYNTLQHDKKGGEREMPHFSEKSLERLDTCNPLLQEIALQAIRVVDFSVVWGHRTRVIQDRFFSEGYSKVEWPRSKHNRWPARAYDLAPWPINWDNRERFFFLAGIILSIARNKEVEVVWGGAWKGQFNQPGEFDDLAHYELLD